MSVSVGDDVLMQRLIRCLKVWNRMMLDLEEEEEDTICCSMMAQPIWCHRSMLEGVMACFDLTEEDLY